MARNLDNKRQEGGMRGLSNCWQAFTWHMNLKAICLCSLSLESADDGGYARHMLKETESEREEECLQLLPSFLSDLPPTHL